jgi:CDGSH-type Zn-finger protein
MTTDQLERFHRRPKRDKAIEPPLRKRCSSPACRTGWEREPDGPYCLACHQRIKDRADEIRARANERTKSA